MVWKKNPKERYKMGSWRLFQCRLAGDKLNIIDRCYQGFYQRDLTVEVKKSTIYYRRRAVGNIEGSTIKIGDRTLEVRPWEVTRNRPIRTTVLEKGEPFFRITGDAWKVEESMPCAPSLFIPRLAIYLPGWNSCRRPICPWPRQRQELVPNPGVRAQPWGQGPLPGWPWEG